ncbi:MAG: ATP-binding cassette domain-containing protein [Actinobacteria bacterium]|nr:ATP-binding cassette domain-containing protein [Actinomycetota bacterium]MCI0543453.1 ATP-binding cassette domain-containing protein [Actinomycetota bacterium]MCI0677504.1 ATP-binding cassette domain-containing protein [Actinomycetota bacterium]
MVVLEESGVSLGGRPVLRGVTLTLSAGQVMGLAGPNGSGKTTLLRLMATLQRPDQGRVEVLGAVSGTTDVYRVRPAIGLIGHAPSLIPELTLAENLSHIARLAGIDSAGTRESLALVGLERASGRRADASSSGMLRRVEIAALLMRRPRLLLLDEATSGLDRDAVGLVDALVARALSAGGAAVMVSHDRTLLSGCDSVVELTGGRVMG